MTNVIIPNSVTSIGVGAFYHCSSLTSLIIPSSVSSIEELAFSGCERLKDVSCLNFTAPKASYNTFDKATYTEAMLHVPQSSLKSYKESSPWNYFKNIKEIETSKFDQIVDGIKYRFYSDGDTCSVIGCDQDLAGDIVLRSKVRYDGVTYDLTSIGYRAFYGCSSLTSVTIPNSVTSIGGSAFSSCSSLTEINVAEDSKYYKSIDDVLFNKDVTNLVAFPGGKGGEYVIPNSVTSIGKYAFSGCSSLTSVTIPNSVTSIGDWAFDGCSSLKSVTIPNSVTEIGGCAFNGCSSLTSVSIPNTVTYIGGSAFDGCSSLTSLIIPNSVTEMGGDSYGLNKLTYLSVPNSTIGEGKFLVDGWETPATIKITEGDVNYDLNKGLLAYWPYYPIGPYGDPKISRIEKVIIECKKIVIRPDRFGDFQTLVLGKDMEEIVAKVWEYSSPSETGAFSNYKDLNEIYSLNPVPPVCEKKDFNDATYESAQLYIPKGSLNAYMQYTPWKYFKNIKEIDPTGIAQTKIDGFGVAITSNGLTLSGVDGKAVSIFTADGCQAYATAHYSGGPITLPRGLYIVKAGGKVMKVAVK